MSDPNPEDRATAIKAALFAGKKIEAIKLYREQTKLGLAESKEAVETLEAELRKTQPESFKSAPPKGGCGMSLVVLALGVLATIRLWQELR